MQKRVFDDARHIELVAGTNRIAVQTQPQHVAHVDMASLGKGKGEHISRSRQEICFHHAWHQIKTSDGEKRGRATNRMKSGLCTQSPLMADLESSDGKHKLEDFSMKCAGGARASSLAGCRRALMYHKIRCFSSQVQEPRQDGHLGVA